MLPGASNLAFMFGDLYHGVSFDDLASCLRWPVLLENGSRLIMTMSNSRANKGYRILSTHAG